MNESITLSEMQIKRRQLENELASLSQTEEMLESDLKMLEAKIIEQLKAEIETKRSALGGLESRKNDLQRKLKELQEKSGGSQTAEEQNTSETEEIVQHSDTAENDTELTIVGYQQEQV